MSGDYAWCSSVPYDKGGWLKSSLENLKPSQFIGHLQEGDRINVMMPNGAIHERIVVSVGTDGEGCEQIVLSSPESKCHEDAKWRHA